MLYQVPDFPEGNVPVTIAASIMGKDQQFLREAMKRGLIDLGICYKKENSEQYDFYISPFKLWQLTGYVYKGNHWDCGGFCIISAGTSIKYICRLIKTKEKNINPQKREKNFVAIIIIVYYNTYLVICK